MKTEMFNDPLNDNELFMMLRDSFEDDQSAWETVREAQAVYRGLNKRIILKEMEDERTELLTFNHSGYAA